MAKAVTVAKNVYAFNNMDIIQEPYTGGDQTAIVETFWERLIDGLRALFYRLTGIILYDSETYDAKLDRIKTDYETALGLLGEGASLIPPRSVLEEAAATP